MEKYITGFDGYFRNNSTNQPTKVHLLNPKTERSFCGFSHVFAEVYFKEEFAAHHSDVCKKCLKLSVKWEVNNIKRNR